MHQLSALPNPSLNSKRVLITGANGGLGLATTIAALHEGATVTLACRTGAKAHDARTRALQATDVPSDHAIAAGGFDMLDPQAIDAAVAALPSEPLDVVFLQAGGWVWADEVQTTSLRGIAVERSVVKNVIGAHATLRALQSTGRLAPGCRVVIIGGEGARGVPGAIAKPSFADLEDFERYLAGDWTGRTPYVAIDALGVAKLCAALWAQELARVAAGEFEVLWFTPGLIGGTGGTAGMPKWKEFLFQRIAFPLMVALGKAQWPERAAAKCVDCLAGRVGEHGDLLGAPEGTALGPITDQKPMQPLFTNRQFQRAIWKLCERTAGELSRPRQQSIRATGT